MQPIYKRKLQTYIPRLKLIFFGLIILFLFIIIAATIRYSNQHEISPLAIWKIITNDTSQVKNYQNRVNILLLGIGGATHEGGDLTDTILLLSLDLKKKDAVMLSIPRDIWIPTLKNKINAAYQVGDEKTQGTGFILAKAAVEEVVGIPVHYALLIDFAGFKKLVDLVGGIDVYVEESFTDNLYPIAGRENDLCDGDPDFLCRYETVTFTQGKEHMDGERALKYARSRHAKGEAGTDFSRGRRQQAILKALKEKLFSIKTLEQGKLWQLIKVGESTVATDMGFTERMLLIRYLISNSTNVRSFSLTQENTEKNEKGLLINPPLWQYEGKWVLVPKHNDFGQINKYVICILENQSSCEQLID